MLVKCNKCGYIGDESEFPKGRDFFQKTYIRCCAKRCGNIQSPGGASMRMLDNEHPFVYIREDVSVNADSIVLHRADEAS